MTVDTEHMSEAANDTAPKSLAEWNENMPKLSTEELLVLITEIERITANSTLISSHDHLDKAWELVDDGKLEFDQNLWAFTPLGGIQ